MLKANPRMYITLGLRNYHRGPPMIPEHIGAEKGQAAFETASELMWHLRVVPNETGV